METGTVLLEDRREIAPVGGPVMQQALEKGWITEFAEGQYVYGPDWTSLLRRMQDLIRTHAIKSLGFQEWIFPRVIPRDALNSLKLTQFAPDLLLPAESTNERYLDPVQCISLYHCLRETTLKPDLLPIKVVECLGGWTWRNESSDRLDGPFRAIEFHRVEHVFIGRPKDVVRIRRQVRDGILAMLSALGLSWQVVVGKGCMDIPSVTDMQRDSQTPDEVPVQDIEVPIRGCLKEGARSLYPIKTHGFFTKQGIMERNRDNFYADVDEICGCSVEGDHLTKDFAIGAVDGGDLWSGCVGIGMNRLIVAFLYQHGFEKTAWPDTI